MAKRINLSPTAYCNLENGKKKPTVELAFKIQDEFGVENVLELFRQEN